MLIGIAGMFLAPFGMLISKWAAMKAFIDSNNILIVMILVYGSAATLFYWTKWMGKLISNVNSKVRYKHTKIWTEEIPLMVLAFLTSLSCMFFPYISKYVISPYIFGVYGYETSMPIVLGDVKLMLLMLSLFIILPLSFLPIYKNDHRRIVPIYMGGRNLGDNESFTGSMGKTMEFQRKNWYMTSFFSADKLTKWANILSSAAIAAGLFIVIWGVIGR